MPVALIFPQPVKLESIYNVKLSSMQFYFQIFFTEENPLVKGILSLSYLIAKGYSCISASHLKNDSFSIEISF